MESSPRREIDPHSREAQEAVETVAHLPFSIAFENVMYENRIERITRYNYKPRKDHSEDDDPLFIPPSLMTDRFPSQLKSIFPEDSYLIKELTVQQTETNEPCDTHVDLTFTTNGVRHTMEATPFGVRHTIDQENGIETSHEMSPELIPSLLAALVYARYSDPTNADNQPDIASSTIVLPREDNTQTIEQFIMTLGEFTGHSSITTKAAFQTETGSTLIATHTEDEYPQRNGMRSNLSLSEVELDVYPPTSTSTSIIQNHVRIHRPLGILPVGKQSIRYAEHSSSVLFAPAELTAHEQIDPEAQHDRWAQICLSFTKAISKPLKKYKSLD